MALPRIGSAIGYRNMYTRELSLTSNLIDYSQTLLPSTSKLSIGSTLLSKYQKPNDCRPDAQAFIWPQTVH